MNRKFIKVQGIRLSYLDNEADSANIIFFIHGNSGSARYWHKQYEDESLQGYRLIAFDLPAHGESDAAPNPAEDYSLIGLGRIMANAVSTIAPAGSSYVLAGLSLGTNIIAEMLAYKEISPKGIVLISSCITGDELTIDKIFKTEIDLSFLFTDQSDESRVEAGYTSIINDPAERQQCINEYYQVKSPFRSSLGISVAQNKFSDEIKLISGFNGCLLIVFGKNEQAVNIDYLDEAKLIVWNKEIVKISGNHFVNIDNPSEFNSLLRGYLSDYL
ncbi:MAG: alpha/beta fold hydrolase [Cyclobacteriaceae bacterium]|nr:alpha/beta fold hydrolase [Cyclobacteriaceae bacterium]